MTELFGFELKVGFGIFEFKKEDTWIGVYSEKFKGRKGTYFDFWIFLIPCFPIHIIRYKEP